VYQRGIVGHFHLGNKDANAMDLFFPFDEGVSKKIAKGY